MKRSTWLIGILGLGLLGGGAYLIHQRFQAMDARLADMSQQVTESKAIAAQEREAAEAAERRANEAAQHAQQAAVTRDQADQQRQQAESAAKAASATAQQAHQEMLAMRQEREDELNKMQEALSRVVETRRTATGMVMVLPGSSFKFDFDKAELKSQNRETLSRIAGILLASKGYGLGVYGYTDDVGSEQYNVQLSERRAKAVRDYLVQAGLDATIINTQGFGKSNPVARGKTSTARAENRRVEIALTDTSIQYMGEATSTR